MNTSEAMAIPEFITTNKEDDMITQDISHDDKEDKIEKIVVIGIGGAGNNAVQYLYEQDNYFDTVGRSVNHYVLNTDENCLRSMKCQSRIVLGPKKCKGKGAGANINVGKEATMESLPEIKEICKGADLIFLTAGMGGGTGTLGASVVAAAAHEEGTIVVSLVTLPFRYENRMNAAFSGLRELFKYSDSLILIDNQKIVEHYPDLEFSQGLDKANEILANAISGVIKIIHNPSKINTDFEDLKTILHSGGKSQILYNSLEGDELTVLSTDPDKAIESIYATVTDSPLVTKSDIKNASSFLMLFECTHHFTQKIVDKLVQKFSNPDNIQHNNSYENLLDDMDLLINSESFDSFEEDKLPKVIFAYNKIDTDENDTPKIIVTIVATGMDSTGKKKTETVSKTEVPVNNPASTPKPVTPVTNTNSVVNNNSNNVAANNNAPNTAGAEAIDNLNLDAVLKSLDGLYAAGQLSGNLLTTYLQLKAQSALSQLQPDANKNPAFNETTTTAQKEVNSNNQSTSEFSNSIPSVPKVPPFVSAENNSPQFTVEKSANTPVQTNKSLYTKDNSQDIDNNTKESENRRVTHTYSPTDIGIDE